MTENDVCEIERLMEKLGGSIQPIMQESGMKESDAVVLLISQEAEKLKEAFAKVAGAAQNTTDALDSDPVRDIAWLKKAIKHSRNPMERKRLETELNTAYKRRKRKTG